MLTLHCSFHSDTDVNSVHFDTDVNSFHFDTDVKANFLVCQFHSAYRMTNVLHNAIIPGQTGKGTQVVNLFSLCICI